MNLIYLPQVGWGHSKNPVCVYSAYSNLFSKFQLWSWLRAALRCPWHWMVSFKHAFSKNITNVASIHISPRERRKGRKKRANFPLIMPEGTNGLWKTFVLEGFCFFFFWFFEGGWLASKQPSEAWCAFSVPHLNGELKGWLWTKGACFACPTCWAVVLALFSEGGGSWVKVEEHWKGIQASCRNLNYSFSLSSA